MSEEIKDIRVVPESECCGCAACANACPVDAIRMEEGKEGFVFPKVDLNTLYPVRKVCKDLPGAGDRPAEPERAGLPGRLWSTTKSGESAPRAPSLPCWPILSSSGAAWSTVWR